MAISFLDFFGSDPSKMDETCKFSEHTSRILGLTFGRTVEENLVYFGMQWFSVNICFMRARLMPAPCIKARTTDTQWRHKSKISEKLGRCGRQNMLPSYLKIWDWDWIFGHAVKAISSLGVRSPCHQACPLRILMHFSQGSLQVCWKKSQLFKVTTL